jgi:LmbE family N-acetylglucosaminyl deacetylase
VSGGSCLVIAPHPDDEVIGCGAATLRTRDSGQPVRVVFVTDGRYAYRSSVMSASDIAVCREAEALQACQRLGVPAGEVVFLRHSDGAAQERIDAIVAGLRREVGDFKPACVLSPLAMDSHRDHRAVAKAVDRLVRAGAIHCPVYEYPVWLWTLATWRDSVQARFKRDPHWPFRAASLLRPRTVAVAGYQDRKRSALAAHRSQIVNLTGEPAWQPLDPDFLLHFLGPHELFFEKPRPRKPGHTSR